MPRQGGYEDSAWLDDEQSWDESVRTRRHRSGFRRLLGRVFLALLLILTGAAGALFLTQTSWEEAIDSATGFWGDLRGSLLDDGIDQPNRQDNVTQGADSPADGVSQPLSATETPTPTSTPAPDATIAATPLPVPVSPWADFAITEDSLGKKVLDRLSAGELECLRSVNVAYLDYFKELPLGVRLSTNPPVHSVDDLPELASCLSDDSTAHMNQAIAIFNDPSLATTPTPTVTPIPGPTDTPTPIPTATPVVTPSPHLQHLDEKQYMLQLINNARRANGLTVVELGNNIAAQLHAESALKNCVSSHWGSDGIKPNMRYSLAGGYQSNGENVSGLDYCYSASDWVRPIANIHQNILRAHEGLMDSPGHRANILRATHRKVNIGLAWNRYNLYLVQHFEGNHVEYDQLPEISDGVLEVKGRLTSEFRFVGNDPLGIQIYYDPPPYNLTPGQASRTYCYDNGLQVGALRPPLSGGDYYPTHSFTQRLKFCPSPYDVPSTAQPAHSGEEAHRIWANVKAESERLGSVEITVPWITATRMQTQDRNFEVRAPIHEVLQQHGPGVYSVIVWGDLANYDESVVISEYSIFHRINPPTTYDP